MEKDIIIKAEHLYFSYDDGNTYSLNDFNIEIERGHKVAFMGANGAGKSTFFLSLNGINELSKGEIYIDGKKVEYDKKTLLDVRKNVGIVFQDPDNQLFSASVKQEISFGALNIGMSQEEAEEAVNEVIEMLEITPFKDKATHSLSGGQKKQVSIADVLVMDPKIVILDEPAAYLDPKHRIIVNRMVDMLTEKGITVLISTHDVEYAYAWADDIAVIQSGRVRAFGDPISIFRNQKMLDETNLEKPAALEIFDNMVDKKVLSDNLPAPRTLKELEGYIDKAF